MVLVFSANFRLAVVLVRDRSKLVAEVAYSPNEYVLWPNIDLMPRATDHRSARPQRAFLVMSVSNSHLTGHSEASRSWHLLLMCLMVVGYAIRAILQTMGGKNGEGKNSIDW